MQFAEAIRGFYLFLSSTPKYSTTTARNYRSTLFLFGDSSNLTELESVTSLDVSTFLAKYRNPTTYCRYRQILVNFFNWANVELNLPIPKIPAPVRRPDSEIIPFSHQDLKKLFAHAKTLRSKVILFLLLDTGIRSGELCRLNVQDVNLDTGEVVIKKFETGIKSRPRTVWLSHSTINVVWKYLAGRSAKPTDPLIDTTTGSRLERFGLRKILMRIANNAGVKNVYPHRFRHTFAIEYLRNGGDVFTLKRLLGHSRLSMTEKYLSIANADVQTAHHRASPVDNLRLK